MFKHEAVCVDPVDKRLYLTEDIGDAGFYRFTPEAYPSLDKGLLEIAVVGPDGVVAWKAIPKPLEPPIRAQVPEYTRFKRGEGIWFDSGTVYMATTSDDRIYAYNCVTEVLDVLYDGKKLGDDAPLHEVDNVTVAPRSGDIFVSEDADDLNLCIITPEREVAPFVQVTGPQHTESEVTGPAFDPSGTRLYFSSQRGFGAGLIYEVSGPFRKASRDVIAPELRLEVPASARLRTLRKRGLLVGVRCPEAADLTVALRMGKRTLARRAIEVEEPGVERALLKLSRRGREALRGRRPKTLKVTVSAKDAAGNRRVISKTVRLR